MALKQRHATLQEILVLTGNSLKLVYQGLRKTGQERIAIVEWESTCETTRVFGGINCEVMSNRTDTPKFKEGHFADEVNVFFL